MVTFRGDQCSMRVYESASSYPVVNNHLLSWLAYPEFANLYIVQEISWL